MLLTKIPHFRELTVCSFECPHCGNRCAKFFFLRAYTCIFTSNFLYRTHTAFRNNEVQFAGAYGELGVRYALTVRVGDAQALSRQASLPCFIFLGF